MPLIAAGKVTVCLASHWPCVTDNSDITTYGLMALGRKMSTPPKLQYEYGTLYLFTNREGALCIDGLCLSVRPPVSPVPDHKSRTEEHRKLKFGWKKASR